MSSNEDTTTGAYINPTAWYKFDDSTNIALDSLATYYIGNTNTVTTTIGLKGRLCACFYGTYQYLSGRGVNLNTKSFSISC